MGLLEKKPLYVAVLDCGLLIRKTLKDICSFAKLFMNQFTEKMMMRSKTFVLL